MTYGDEPISFLQDTLWLASKASSLVLENPLKSLSTLTIGRSAYLKADRIKF